MSTTADRGSRVPVSCPKPLSCFSVHCSLVHLFNVDLSPGRSWRVPGSGKVWVVGGGGG